MNAFETIITLAPGEFDALLSGRQRALLVPGPIADEAARVRRVRLREFRQAPGEGLRAPGATGRELVLVVTHVRRDVASTWRGGPVPLAMVSVSTEHQARRVARLRRAVRTLQEALGRAKVGAAARTSRAELAAGLGEVARRMSVGGPV